MDHVLFTFSTSESRLLLHFVLQVVVPAVRLSCRNAGTQQLGSVQQQGRNPSNKCPPGLVVVRCLQNILQLAVQNCSGRVLLQIKIGYVALDFRHISDWRVRFI